MRSFFLDASALVKRYAPETGTALVNHLMTRVGPNRHLVMTLGIAEVVSVLVRKRNEGRLTAVTFAQALQSFGADIIHSAELRKIEVDNRVVMASLPLVEAHALNATDAILLRSALDISTALRTAGDELVLCASDQRLLRAASAERLECFDPEADTQAALDVLIAS